MRRDPRKYMHDMLDSCEFLREFTRGKSIGDYIGDRGFRSAVERELQISGEALYQLDRESPDLAQRVTEHRRIIAFRHVLVHGYDRLNPETVWAVIEVKLSSLYAELQFIISSDSHDQ